MSHRVANQNTAFGLDQVLCEVKDPSHLRLIRELPSMITGEYGCEAAHVNFFFPPIGKPHRGKSKKQGDCFVLPLTPALHRAQHKIGAERAWWLSKGISHPNGVALHLYAISKQKIPHDDKVFYCSKVIHMVNQGIGL